MFIKRLLPVSGLLAMAAVLPSHSLAATAVTITDSTSSNVSCGNLVDLEVTKDNVNLTADASCLGSTGVTPVALNFPNAGSVVEGSNISINVGTGAVVELPVTTTARDPIGGQGEPDVPGNLLQVTGATTVTYIAPPAGTVTGPSLDTFYYTLHDGSGGSDEASVTVTVLEGQSTGDGCVTTGTVVCMGLNPDWPGGTTSNPESNDGNFTIPPGYTHVWSFPYLGGHATGVGTIGTINGTPKRQSVSLTAAYFSPTDDECSNMQETGEGAIAFEPAPGVVSWRCDLTNGNTYYYNLRNESLTTPSEYKIVIF